MRVKTWWVALVAMIASAANPGHRLAAQEPDAFDPIQVALAWHKLTGEPLDLQALAETSPEVRRASSFDRPDAVRAEVARLEALLAGVDPAREMIIQVDDYVTDYDHDRGQFSIQLFTPGYYVPVQAFGRQYHLVFANAEQARAIAMPKEQAREFDAMLSRLGRRVTNSIRFRVVGKGDPAGAVSGQYVVRAVIVSARLIDRAGNVIFTPNLAPASAVAAEPSFDPATADVAGFRVGVRAKDLEATLTRLFGKVIRGNPSSNAPAGVAATLDVNSMGCMHHVGRRRRPAWGTVCVTAMLDREDIVRSIRIERVFPWLDHETFRRTLVARYGPVAAGAGSQLGWGPPVDGAWGGFNAITALLQTNEDLMDAGLNRRPDSRVTLVLVDAAWAAAQTK